MKHTFAAFLHRSLTTLSVFILATILFSIFWNKTGSSKLANEQKLNFITTSPDIRTDVSDKNNKKEPDIYTYTGYFDVPVNPSRNHETSKWWYN